jgi:hypothetical protein
MKGMFYLMNNISNYYLLYLVVFIDSSSSYYLFTHPALTVY